MQRRRRSHLTTKSSRGQCTGHHPETGRTGLVHDRARPRQPADHSTTSACVGVSRASNTSPVCPSIAALRPPAHARPVQCAYGHQTQGPPHTCRTGRARKHARQPTRLHERGPGQQLLEPASSQLIRSKVSRADDHVSFGLFKGISVSTHSCHLIRVRSSANGHACRRHLPDGLGTLIQRLCRTRKPLAGISSRSRPPWAGMAAPKLPTSWPP